MSKANTLGPPAFTPARSARRDAIRQLGGEDAAAAITELPVTVISANPDNPRNHLRNLGEYTESVREVGVILPIVVATTEAYLHDRADRAEDLDDGAKFVVIDGHRRLEASRRVGLATIPVRVDNSRVATDETLLEAAFIANYHRDDMTELEEANALRTLVDHYGSQTQAAKRLGIPQATLSTKLSLLKLTPQLQKDLQSGVRSVEHVRNLGKLSPQEQVEKADQRAEAAKVRSSAEPRVAKPERAPADESGRSSGPAEYHGVIIPDTDRKAPPAAGTEQPPAVRQEAAERTGESVPEPREHQDSAPDEPAADGLPKRLPYDDGVHVGLHLAVKMDDDAHLAMLDVSLKKAWDRYPERLDELLAKRQAERA